MNSPLATLTYEDVFEQEVFKTESLHFPAWRNGETSVAYLTPKTDILPALLAHYRLDTRAHEILTPAETLQVGMGENGAPEFLILPGFQFSPNEQTVLLARTPRRRNFGEGDPALYLYHLEEKRLERLTQEDAAYLNAKFSPDGQRVGYVKKNDLFVLDLQTRREIRLTDTGDTARFNGRFGWVYEEELDVSDGWAWSPDGRWIAYVQTDESQVPLVFVPQFANLHQTPYPQRYPKAGDPNPAVRLGIIETQTLFTEAERLGSKTQVPETRWLFSREGEDGYLARMQWTPDSSLLVQSLPRRQDRIEVIRIEPSTGTSETLREEISDTWIDAPGELHFTDGDGAFLWMTDRRGMRQIEHYSRSGELLRILTPETQEAAQIVGISRITREVFYTAQGDDPRDLLVYRVGLDEEIPRRLTPGHGGYTPLVSDGGKHLLLTKAARNTPPFTALHSGNGDYLGLVHGNEMNGLKGKQTAEWERFSLSTERGETLFGQWLKPADFRPDQRYPVLMYVYGGPHSQITQERYTDGYEQLLAASGYLVVQVDGRGSGGRGREFCKTVFKRLGRCEAEDQITAADWLAQKPFVDPARIGIWGWSYGGYLALLCLLRGGERFRAGVAVAPVTHWKFYDSIYTERYLTLPSQNVENYERSSPLNEAENLKSKLLLVHGTGDDNVHVQNTIEFALRLQKANLSFEMMTYSAEKHGLSGVTRHLYKTMFEFIQRNL